MAKTAVAGGKGNFVLNQNYELQGVDVTLLTVDFIVDVSAEVGDLTSGSTVAGLDMTRHAFAHHGLQSPCGRSTSGWKHAKNIHG
jgi:hypothetical protein